MATRLRWAAPLLLVLVCATAGAGADFRAVLIQSYQPPRVLQLEKVEINKKDALYRITRDAPLTKKQYEDLPKLPFAEIYSLRVTNKGLQVRTRTGGELQAVPQELDPFSGSLTPDAITLRSKLFGRTLTKQAFSDTLKEGWVVYLFTTPPATDTIAFVVAEAQNTPEGWSSFLDKYSRSPRAPDAAKPLVETYLARTRESLERFQAAMTDKKPGYGNLLEARKWLNEAMRWVAMVRPPAPPVADLQSRLTFLENDIRDRLNRARQQAENNDCVVAGQTLEPLQHFRDEFPDLAATLDANLIVCTRHALNRVEELIAQEKFPEAERALEDVARISPQEPRIPALQKQIEEKRQDKIGRDAILAARQKARDAMTRNNFAGAFAALFDVAPKFPEDTALQAEFAEVHRKYGEDLLAKSDQEEKLYKEDLADEGTLLTLQVELARLIKIGPPADLAARLRVTSDRLRKILADYYYAKHAEMAKRAGANPASILTFAYLQHACHYGPERCPPDFPTARTSVERDLRIGVALTFRDLTTKSLGPKVEAELLPLVSAAVERAHLPRVNILARRDTTGLDLEFNVDLLEATTQDQETQKEQVKSEYSDRTRQVQNPKWLEAKTAHDRALETLDRARAEETRLKGKGPKRDQEARTAAVARADTAFKAAKATWDTTPPFIDQEDVRPYEFTRKTLVRTAGVRISSRWVNAQTGVQDEPKLWEVKDPAQGVEISGVQVGDKNGHRNEPATLPDRDSMLEGVLRKVEQQLADHAISYLKSNFIGGYFEQGRLKAGRAEHESAAEDYIRFLFNSPSDADPARRDQALDYLRDRHRLVALEWLGVTR